MTSWWLSKHKTRYIPKAIPDNLRSTIIKDDLSESQNFYLTAAALGVKEDMAYRIVNGDSRQDKRRGGARKTKVTPEIANLVKSNNR